MSYSREIYSRIIKFLNDDDWHYRFDEDQEVIKMGLTLHNKMKKTDITIDLRDNMFFVYMTCPLNVDEAERGEMTRLLNRINWGLLFGSFEMDERDGEIKFRYSVDCDAQLPSQEVIRHSMYRPASTMEKYGDAIVMVLMGFSNAEDAYKSAQKKD